jgi:xanthine dehydrogenase small subunit
MRETSDTLRFLLNGSPHEARGVDPHTSVLAYLREHLFLTGTKEGCAEGDCGACTVAIAERNADGALVVNPINACIRLLPTIDGKALFTVEALSLFSEDGSLHPVQQAMVECHASQCGFCTPGFVMSLFALFKNEVAPSRERVCEAISGNLCRCTGYRPIIDAAMQVTQVTITRKSGEKDVNKPAIDKQQNLYQAPIELGDTHKSSIENWLRTPAAIATQKTQPTMHEANIAQALAALQRASALDYSANGNRFIAPRSVDEFSALVEAHPDAWILSGGTDIGLWINKALQTNATMLYTGEIAALKTIVETERDIAIGAAVSLEDAFRAMNHHYPELAHLWTRFASWPIRTSGTLGGNVANGSPIGDSMPALIALDAQVVLRKGNTQRTIPLETLYLDYKKQSRAAGEWLEAIRIPKRIPGLQTASYKNSKRNEQDISAVCAAIAMTVERGVVSNARIAYGGVAGIPKRATNCEAALVGKQWNEASVREAMHAMTKDFTPMSDMRASAEYRMQVAQNHLLRFWYERGSVPEKSGIARDSAPNDARVF